MRGEVRAESQTVPVATISPSVQEAAAQWLTAEARLVYDHTRGRGGVGMLQSCQERHGDRRAMATAEALPTAPPAFGIFAVFRVISSPFAIESATFQSERTLSSN